MGDSSFPPAGGQGAFPPSLSARPRGSGQRAEARPGAAPEPRAGDRQPLLAEAMIPAVPGVSAFRGGRRSGAALRDPYPTPGHPGLTARGAAGAAGWAHPRAPGSRRSEASRLQARALRGRCRTSPFPAAPPATPQVPSGARRRSRGDTAQTLHSLPQCI